MTEVNECELERERGSGNGLDGIEAYNAREPMTVLCFSKRPVPDDLRQRGGI